jgi:curved DNA-binding protein CbpA
MKRNIDMLSNSVMIVASFWLVASFAQEFSTMPCQSSSVAYEWENYDYYQILGFDQTSRHKSRSERLKMRRSIDSKDIRRAYRKQAQLYHPDKLGNMKSSKATEQENNLRFLRISDAYQALTSTEKRDSYDQWLLNCEDDYTKTMSSEHQSHSRFESFYPRINLRGLFSNSYREKGKSHPNGRPIKSEESNEVWTDRYTGQKIHRVVRSEEFAPDAAGQYRYRVTVQDFVRIYSPLYGWYYNSLSPPVVTDSGFRNTNYAMKPGLEKMNSTDILTRNSKPLISLNGKYYAGITATCELIVVAGNPDAASDEDLLLWSSKTFIPSSAGDCFLTLKGPFLLLVLGTQDIPGPILWKSEIQTPTHLGVHWDDSQPYFARLDDDGSLVVYYQHTVCLDDFDSQSFPIVLKAFLYWKRMMRIIEKITQENGDSNLKRSAKLSRWREEITRLVFKRFKNASSYEGSDELSHMSLNVCIFATGSAGCNIPGRKIVQLLRYFRTFPKSASIWFKDLLELLVDCFDENILDNFLQFADDAKFTVYNSVRIAHRKIVDILWD